MLELHKKHSLPWQVLPVSTYNFNNKMILEKARIEVADKNGFLMATSGNTYL